MSCNDGNCGRIAVRVQKIYNGASLLTRGTFSAVPDNFTPAAYTLPLTYISADYRGDVGITSFNVTPIAGTARSRVALAFSYDATVVYEDASGVRGRAAARIEDAADLLVTLPDSPYTLFASVEFASAIGSITPDRADITACRRLLLRVLVPCDIIVCACGTAVLPDARTTEDLVCRQLQ